MEEMFEYLIPLSGLFKKKRDPKIIESYKRLEDFDEIVEDFKAAKSFVEDRIRMGSKCLFVKEKVTIYYAADIVKAEFIVHGYDSTDEFGSINLTFRDGSWKEIYRTPEIDGNKVAAVLFAVLNAKGINTDLSASR